MLLAVCQCQAEKIQKKFEILHGKKLLTEEQEFIMIKIKETIPIDDKVPDDLKSIKRTNEKQDTYEEFSDSIITRSGVLSDDFICPFTCDGKEYYSVNQALKDVGVENTENARKKFIKAKFSQNDILKQFLLNVADVGLRIEEHNFETYGGWCYAYYSFIEIDTSETASIFDEVMVDLFPEYVPKLVKKVSK